MKTLHRPEGDRASWNGKVISVQPRIRLTRSFDQRTHSYLGYIRTVQGLVGGLGSSRIAFTSDDEVVVCEVPVFCFAGVAEGRVAIPIWFFLLVALLFVVPCPLHVDRVELSYF